MGIKHRVRVSELLRNGWAKPEMSTRMLPNEVQVWRLDLSCPEGQSWVEAGWDLLSLDELTRAKRVRAGTPRDELVAGRAALRCLLAQELNCDPGEVEFRVGGYGKPALANGGIDFNVTHSRGMILIALSRAGAVGIDVEDSTRDVEALDVARTAFHCDELRSLEAVEEEQRPSLFYRIWTRKEAVAKADGRGLMLPAQSFSVTEGVSGEAVEIAPSEDPVQGCEKFSDDVAFRGRYHGNYYHLHDLNPGRGFIAALALGQCIASIAQYDVHPALDPKRGILLVHPAAEMA